MKTVRTRGDALLLQKDIDTMQEWSRKWLLKFHRDKCHDLTLGKFNNIKYAHNYLLCQKELEHVFFEKDLGVTIDAELSFEIHISEKVNKANSVIGQIYRRII